MAVHRVKRGLDLPISGAPQQTIDVAQPVTEVAILARDYVGAQLRALVEEGAKVRLGQPILEDRKNPGVRLVSPGAGRLKAIHRGERRALLSVVIELEGDDAASFGAYSPAAGNDRAGVARLLLESGLWAALRTRPFSRIPAPVSAPRAIFVTAIDTHPLAPRPEIALEGREADFERGLTALATLTDGPVYLCRQAGAPIEPGGSGARVEEFSGKHPAGTVGYHIHRLDPVFRGKVVWHVGYPDVARIGRLFATGALDPTAIVSLAGPVVARPRLVRTRLGASTTQLTRGEVPAEGARLISGSVLHGDQAGAAPLDYLGRYHLQLSALREGRPRELLGWIAPGPRAFSILPTFLASLLPRPSYEFDTSTRGSKRAMVPLGMYERVMPMDLMPTHLLRALTVGDVEWAEELGALELSEEDLSLCTFVCPGKYDNGSALRRVLTTIEAEG